MPYPDVTMQDICRDSGISRSTFYRTFQSKYEICTWNQEVLLAASIGQVGRTLGWRDAFAAFHSGWLLFPHVNLGAKDDSGPESIESHWVRTVRRMLLESLSEKGVPVDDLLSFQVNFFATTTRPQRESSSSPWSNTLYGLDPREYGRMMASCVPRDLFSLLDMASDPREERLLTVSSLFRAD